MNDKSKIPERLLNQLSEHSSCFCLFYFDDEGKPCFYQNFTEYKDKMAIIDFLRRYVESDGFPFGEPPEDTDDGTSGERDDFENN